MWLFGSRAKIVSLCAGLRPCPLPIWGSCMNRASFKGGTSRSRSGASSPTVGRASGLESPPFEPAFGHALELAQPGGPAQRHGRPNAVAQIGAAGLDCFAGAPTGSLQPHASQADADTPRADLGVTAAGRLGNAAPVADQ